MSKLSRRDILKLLGALGISAVLPDVSGEENTPDSLSIDEPRVAPNKCPGLPYQCGWYMCTGTEEQCEECRQAAIERRDKWWRGENISDSKGEALWTSMRSRERDDDA